MTELCQALGLPTPDPEGAGLGDYQFEAPVKSEAVLGTKGTGRIDRYLGVDIEDALALAAGTEV